MSFGWPFLVQKGDAEKRQFVPFLSAKMALLIHIFRNCGQKHYSGDHLLNCSSIDHYSQMEQLLSKMDEMTETFSRSLRGRPAPGSGR